MANKSEKEKREDKEIQTSKEEIKLNDLFQDLYKKISMNTHDVDEDVNKTTMDTMSEKIRRVIADDMEEMKSYGGENDLSRFLINTIQKSGSNKFSSNIMDPRNENALENLFSSGDGAIFSTFQERFKNK